MSNPPTLYMLCGKMAAGKSTLAKDLSRRLGVPLLCEDDLLAALFPNEITDVPTYVKFSSRLKKAIEGMVIELLKHGTSVVLDFPANTLKQRAWLAGLAEQANVLHELHYIDRSDSDCKKQLQKRATENPERAATDTIEMFDAINQYFEPPSASENLAVVLL